MSTPEDRLIRSLPALRALVDSLTAHPPSEARDLLQLDLLVRRYPAAARKCLRLLRRVEHGAPDRVPGWYAVSAPDQDTPVWARADDTLCVATADADLLRFIDAAVRRFDRMTAEELHAFLRG